MEEEEEMAVNEMWEIGEEEMEEEEMEEEEMGEEEAHKGG